MYRWVFSQHCQKWRLCLSFFFWLLQQLTIKPSILKRIQSRNFASSFFGLNQGVSRAPGASSQSCACELLEAAHVHWFLPLRPSSNQQCHLFIFSSVVTVPHGEILYLWRLTWLLSLQEFCSLFPCEGIHCQATPYYCVHFSALSKDGSLQVAEWPWKPFTWIEGINEKDIETHSQAFGVLWGLGMSTLGVTGAVSCPAVVMGFKIRFHGGDSSPVKNWASFQPPWNTFFKTHIKWKFWNFFNWGTSTSTLYILVCESFLLFKPEPLKIHFLDCLRWWTQIQLC